MKKDAIEREIKAVDSGMTNFLYINKNDHSVLHLLCKGMVNIHWTMQDYMLPQKHVT